MISCLIKALYLGMFCLRFGFLGTLHFRYFLVITGDC